MTPLTKIKEEEGENLLPRLAKCKEAPNARGRFNTSLLYHSDRRRFYADDWRNTGTKTFRGLPYKTSAQKGQIRQ